MCNGSPTFIICCDNPHVPEVPQNSSHNSITGQGIPPGRWANCDTLHTHSSDGEVISRAHGEGREQAHAMDRSGGWVILHAVKAPGVSAWRCNRGEVGQYCNVAVDFKQTFEGGMCV